MSKIAFSGSEMLRIAILMEEEGYNYYNTASKYSNGKVKEFFNIAAGQEFIHREKFTKLLNHLAEGNEEESDYLFDPEIAIYLKDTIENKVYKKDEKPVSFFNNIKQAIEYAINSEELSVKVYTEMFGQAMDKAAKETFAEILNEEKAHAAYFTKLLNDITD